MKIVVIGRSGLIGRNVVRRLVAQGHDPVPASPATGVDTITGKGLVGAEDVAATIAELAIGAPVGERVELGGPRRWASTPGRGGCSRPPAMTEPSSLSRTLATTPPSCTAAS